MRIGVDLKESDDEIIRMVLQQIQSRLNSAIHRAAPAIRIRLQDLCDHLIQGTPEYKSLLTGELLAELGIPDVVTRLENILQTIKENIEVSVIPVQTRGRGLVGGMNIGILKDGYQDILSMTDARYISPPSGETIEWLEWLIGQGDRIIVMGYDVTYNLNAAQKARSRTGMALMRPGMGWRVPPEYSGTYDDNFLTRAFNVANVEAIVAGIMSQEINMRL